MNMIKCSLIFPSIGDNIYGFVGDFIDILSVICTMFGVCTSLGLGVMQLNAGLYRLNSNIEVGATAQVIIIWVITASKPAIPRKFNQKLQYIGVIVYMHCKCYYFLCVTYICMFVHKCVVHNSC